MFSAIEMFWTLQLVCVLLFLFFISSFIILIVFFFGDKWWDVDFDFI